MSNQLEHDFEASELHRNYIKHFRAWMARPSLMDAILPPDPVKKEYKKYDNGKTDKDSRQGIS